MKNIQEAQEDMRKGYADGAPGLLLEIILGHPGKHQKENPLGKLAMEGTIWMIMCIPLAYGLSSQKPEWFFQGMLLIIGGRYLTFSTLYGQRWYWVLGGLSAIAANSLFATRSTAFLSALTGGIIEIGFGLWAYIRFRSRSL